METNTKTYTLQALLKKVDKNDISLQHKLQRKPGQWNNKKKGLLVQSLLLQYPILPLFAVKDESGLYIIDGVQRISALNDYVKNDFALPKDLSPVKIGDTEYDIAGKKFVKLDEEVIDALFNAQLQLHILSDYTEQDIREVFLRLNNGKPLSAKQMRSVHLSDDLLDAINALTDMPFIQKSMSRAQIKSSTDRDIIIQTLMLLETNDEHQFTSFKSVDIDKFVEWLTDNLDTNNVKMLSHTLEALGNIYEEGIKIPATSLPMLLWYATTKTIDGLDINNISKTIDNFNETYSGNAEYKQYCSNGTSATANVVGRWNYWKAL